MHLRTNFFKQPSLRKRLLVALLLPLALIFSVSSLLDYRLASETADSAHDQSLLDSLFDLETHVQDRQGEPGLELAKESESMLRSSTPDNIYFSIQDPAGRVLFGDHDLPHFSRPSGSSVVITDGEYHGMSVRVALHRTTRSTSELFITVVETTRKRTQSRQRILTAMILHNAAVIFATLLAVLLGVRQGLHPLKAVEKEIASRSANDLRAIDLAAAPNEIRPMLARLNEFFALLRDAAAAQKRFMADAAHQLRTPLAGLQTQLDVARQQTPLQAEDSFARMQEATERLGHLLNQLLSFARAESSAAIHEAFEAIALDDLAEGSASIFLDQALAKNIDLGFDLSPASANGIPWLLQEALANLIDNAIRYTPTGGVITVRCGKANGPAFLEVEDNGPGIAEAQRHAVFERFYRIPGSPSSGCGLGLPIVKEIAELHGAHIRLFQREGGGLRVRLEFPP